jgi:arylsulfatase A-like enzyme
LVVVLAATAVAWWFSSRPGPPQPNVFVFMLDTVRRDAFGCYGHPGAPTPIIDALAVEGVRFDQAVSTSGWTLPAIASFMTGTWPVLHGAVGRGVVLTPIRGEVPTAAEVLRRNGFATVGIANAAFVSPMVGMDRGFDIFDHRYSYNWDTRRAEETIGAAITELRQRRSSAGFYFIHLFDAHLDYNPPPEYAAKFTRGRLDPPLPLTYEIALDLQSGENGEEPPLSSDVDYIRGLYQGEVSFVDSQIGRFIEELKSLGLYDHATIVVTSDHGEEFWDHGGFEHGHTLYDELVLIPLVIKFPTSMDLPGRVVQPQVRLLDVMPTVFEILGVTSPESFVGESLMSLVRGDTNADLDALSESTLYGAPLIALRGPRYKYIMELVEDATGEGKLYDWREDPLERNDLAAELPEKSDELRAALIGTYRNHLIAAQRMSSPQPVNLDPKRIDQLRSLGYIR